MKFSEAQTDEDMIQVLTNAAGIKHHRSNGEQNYVYHYTNRSSALAIMKSKLWYMNSPKYMNDGLELIYLEEAKTSNIFFGSFLSEQEESIAMWSLYAQPWIDGVIIRIPVEKMKEWVKRKARIYKADRKTKKPLELLDQPKMELHLVAYTNGESLESKEDEVMRCGNQENTNFHGILDHYSLAGYVKDMAWSYEKELRLRVSIDSNEEIEAVTIEIPDEIINSFEFITGPRFEGNLLAQMRQKVDKKFNENRIVPSLFTGRLNRIYCDECEKGK